MSPKTKTAAADAILTGSPSKIKIGLENI
jgi:hypothetical protein